MQVRIERFDVGPILGAVSPNSARLWGRGPERRSEGTLRRAFGAARVRQTGRPFGPTQYFKLSPVFDLTGVTVFQGLRPDTEYEYEIGTFFADAELDDLPAAVQPDWSDAHRSKFRTAARDRNAPRSFVFGSCRYLLRLFGGSFFDGRGDKTFRSINRQIAAGRRTDAVLMLGDQIYADDLNFLAPDQGIDEYFKRYRDAFSQKHFANLVSRIPTYMTLDDHEIEDNWPARATSQDFMRKFPAAIHSYLTYQLSHSPLFPVGADGRLIEQPDRYWYQWGIHLTQVAPRRCGLVDPWTPAHCTQNAPWGARRRSAGNWATRLRFGPIKDYARAMAIAGLETWCYRQAFPGAANGQPQYVVVT